MRVRATSPEFVTVMVCCELDVVSCCGPKVRDWAEMASVAGAVPVPESEAVWVPAPSVIVKVLVRVPEAVGVKVMDTVQPVLGRRVEAQVLAAMWKSPAVVGVCRATAGLWRRASRSVRAISRQDLRPVSVAHFQTSGRAQRSAG